MPVILGFCDKETRSSSLLDINFQIKQEYSSKMGNITFNVAATSEVVGNNAPYYQWGRKDPLLPSNGMMEDTKDKRAYNVYSTLGTMCVQLKCKQKFP